MLCRIKSSCISFLQCQKSPCFQKNTGYNTQALCDCLGKYRSYFLRMGAKNRALQLCKAQNTHAPTISSILVDGIYSKAADRYPDFGSPRTIRLPGTEHSSGMCMVLPDTVAELCRILTCFPDICCQLFDKKGFSNAHVLLYHIFRRLASLFAKKAVLYAYHTGLPSLCS